MSDEPKIAPRIVDGEPKCSKSGCPAWYAVNDRCPLSTAVTGEIDCLPALRRQRDAAIADRDSEAAAQQGQDDAIAELRAELDAARRELCEKLYAGCPGSQPRDLAEVAASRGWSYLYAPAPPATGEEEGGEG